MTRAIYRFTLLFILLFGLLVTLSCVSGSLFPAAQWIPLALKTHLDNDLFLFEVDRRLLVNLTKSPTDRVDPELSPDRHMVIFSGAPFNTFDIYITDLFTGGSLRLTDDSIYDTAPAWSPDETRIAFVSGEANVDVYALNLADHTTRRLTENPFGDTTPSWSPDGHWIAYSGGSSTSPASIFVIDAQCPAQCDASAHRLTDDNDYEAYPIWSPDGQEIAYISVGGVKTGIYLLSTACLQQNTDCLKQKPRLVTDGIIHNNQPFWSDDGQQIFFFGEQQGVLTLFAVSAHCADQTECVPIPLTALSSGFWGLRFG